MCQLQQNDQEVGPWQEGTKESKSHVNSIIITRVTVIRQEKNTEATKNSIAEIRGCLVCEAGQFIISVTRHLSARRICPHAAAL